MECAGAPRDLGRDHAEAAGPALRAASAGSPLRALGDRLGLYDAASKRWLRDVRRHFPHQAEWIEGLARAAAVPELALARAMRAALVEDPGAVVIAARSGSGVRIARTADPRASLRRCRPEGRFASVELGADVLTTPWLGVNEGGLALALVASPAPFGDCAASAALLARDCLERFDSVESALAWCLGRPAAPGVSIALADAGGGLVGVAVEADGRRVLRDDEGVLVLARGGAAVSSLRKAFAVDPLDPDGFEAALGRALGDAASRRSARVDPLGRCLWPGGEAAAVTVSGD